MTKKSGLGQQLLIGGYNLSNDTGAINTLGSPRGVIPQTGIDKFAFERLLTFKDGIINWQAFFNPAANQAHDVLGTLPTADTGVILGQGSAIGDVVACMTAKQINYDGNRNADASFPFSVQALANGFGIEWGLFGTPGVRTDGSATNGAGLDNGASSAFGLQAYCQLLAFTGTSVTIKLQGDDNSGFSSATDVTGGSFGALSTPRTSHRIATANNQTIERYLRVVTTGVFSNAVFAVAIVRNDHAGVVF